MKQATNTRIRVLLLVNNCDNGVHTGYVERVDIGSEVLWLYGRQLRCYVIRAKSGYKPRFLRLGHITVRIDSYTRWAGNWCWDMVTVDAAGAAKIVNYLRRRQWEIESGWASLFEKFRSGQEIAAADLTEEEGA